VAQKVEIDPHSSVEDHEQGMTFVGLIGMMDPPRDEAAQALRTCEQAGIRVIMITGDHPITAQAVARELGVFRHDRVITGVELTGMTEADLETVIDDVDVYARVAPSHKLRLVEMLQRKGHVVAMTGDGVNDAPALRKADIGVAMGITGTDVAKEAADMTLTNDNFASIVAAVEEGRGIFDNIKKYLMFVLSSNVDELSLIGVALIAGLPSPLTALQLLYINLATAGLPALALAVDPPKADLMNRGPRDPNQGVFTRSVFVLMFWGGVWSTLINVGIYAWTISQGGDPAKAMSMIFIALILIQFCKAYAFRSDRVSTFVRPFENRWLNAAILWELVMLFGLVYIPALHLPFGTYPLSVEDWIVVVLGALTILPLLEVVKRAQQKS
jgi:Ca2+-transporting ATPase